MDWMIFARFGLKAYYSLGLKTLEKEANMRVSELLFREQLSKHIT